MSNDQVIINNLSKIYDYGFKALKNINLNIAYDFLSNEIAFKNIMIDGNKVSDQFYNIVEGFNDNNSNNLTKSRRLLNELIGLYEG